jgi:hypothetical protein
MSWLEDHWADIVAMPPIKTRRAACAVARCDRPSQALGLCTAHYNAARQHYDPAFRASYLSAKRDRERAKRRAGKGMAGQLGHPSPNTGVATGDARATGPATRTGGGS